MYGKQNYEICVVDTDLRERERTRNFLLGRGYGVRDFSDVLSLYGSLLRTGADLVVLGELADQNVLAVTEVLGEMAIPVGIVVLTTDSLRESRLQLLQGGADACLSKPVDFRELLVIVESLLRRLQIPSGHVLQAAEKHKVATYWHLSDDGWTLVSPESLAIPLTARERLFMQRLFSVQGVAVSREELVHSLGEDIYHYDFHRLDALVSRLRRKVSDVGVNFPLRAVRGKGYLFIPS